MCPTDCAAIWCMREAMKACRPPDKRPPLKPPDGHQGGEAEITQTKPRPITITSSPVGSYLERPGCVARLAAPGTKLPRATYLGCPITLPMAPRPTYDLTKRMCQRAGPAGRVGWPPSPPARPVSALLPPQPCGGRARRDAPRPSQLRRASRKLPTSSAREAREPGRLPRAD